MNRRVGIVELYPKMRLKVDLKKKPKPLDTNGAQFSNLTNFNKKNVL
jgi:hypothetical protein